MFPTEQSAQLQGGPVTKQSPLCTRYSELGWEGSILRRTHNCFGVAFVPGTDSNISHCTQSCVLPQQLPCKREERTVLSVTFLILKICDVSFVLFNTISAHAVYGAVEFL